MFSFDKSMRYWLYSEPTDMRKSFHMLSGIVRNCMDKDLMEGDVFIFINKNRNRVKLLRKEPVGLVIYSIRLDFGRIRLPALEDGHLSMTFAELEAMFHHLSNDPSYRLRCLRCGIKPY